MRAPVRPVRGRWPRLLEARLGRFFRPDPAVLLDDDVSDEDFRLGMSLIHVGDTIKITGSNRHPNADALLLDNVDLTGRTVVDIGASDGSTSLDLIAKLSDFGAYVIADLYLTLDVVTVGRRQVFFDPDSTPVLVAGRRLIAWPSLSRTVALLYGRTIRAARQRADHGRPLLLLNPGVRQLMARDPRVTYRVHNVFDVWPAGRPDVVKIANLLRRLYFSDDDIRRALVAVHAGLADDGHLLIVDNPRLTGVGPRAGLYRREGDNFVVVAETPHRPEIGDLVTRVGTAVPASDTH